MAIYADVKRSSNMFDNSAPHKSWHQISSIVICWPSTLMSWMMKTPTISCGNRRLVSVVCQNIALVWEGFVINGFKLPGEVGHCNRKWSYWFDYQLRTPGRQSLVCKCQTANGFFQVSTASPHEQVAFKVMQQKSVTGTKLQDMLRDHFLYFHMI